MNEYIFVAGEDDFETIAKVSADDIETAKIKYAKNLWEIDNYMLKLVESNTVNESFWEQYFYELISNRDGSWLQEIDQTKKLFKDNLEKDFSPEISKELLDYFFDREKEINDLSDEAKLKISEVQVKDLLENNFLRIYLLDEIRSIS
jgi:Fic family protein